MTHVKLMGEIGEKFGSDWHMSATSFRDIFKLIECQTEGFAQYIREKAEEGVDFTIQNGDDLIDDGLDLQIAPPQNTVIITPVATGEGSLSNALKVILGVVLLIYGPGWIQNFEWAAEAEGTMEAATAIEGIGTSYATGTTLTTAGQVATWGVRALGVGLAMSGVTGYLTPDSPSNAGESYLFNGPQNNAKEGIAVPLLYGRLIVGGGIINFGFIEDKVTQQQSGYTRVVQGQDAPANSDEETDDSSRGEDI
jgi:predicted phage tail protein